MIHSAAYIGAGWDMRPIRTLCSLGVQRYIYVDASPNIDLTDKQRHRFLDRIFQKIECEGFRLVNEEPFMFEFSRIRVGLECILRYHISNHFPDKMTPSALADLSTCDHLILSGFNPHESVLGLIKSPVHIICWEGTVYSVSEDDGDNIFNLLHKTDMDDKNKIASLRIYKKRYEAIDCQNMIDVEMKSIPS